MSTVTGTSGRTPGTGPANTSTVSLVSPILLATTVILAVTVAATSLLGLLAPWPYAVETAGWRLQAHGQDLGNLLALAVLLAGVVAARRGSPAGVHLWLGALLYLGYAFVIYAFTIHFGPLFLAYVAVLGLSCYTLLFGVTGVRARGMALAVPARSARWLLTGIAVLFALLWLSAIVPALASGRAPAELVEIGLASNPVHVLDLAIVLPGMAITARLAVRDAPTARLLVAAWLVFSALMGASIVITLLLSEAPAPPLLVVGAVTVASAACGVRELRRPLQT